MIHERVEANGIRLHVVRAGSGPLILFLHGFPDYWACWQRQLEYFGARGFCAVAPDLRGFNLSDKPEGAAQYRAKHVIADVAAIAARYAGREEFTLVAHDWGGAVAWGFALAKPEALKGLVICNSPHPYLFWRALCDDPAQQQASDYFLLFRQEKAERVLAENNYARLWGMIQGDWGGGGGTEREDFVAAMSQPGALTGGLNYYRATPVYPPSGEDPGARKIRLDAKDFVVRVPTLVLWGERDRALLPSLLDGLDALVPDLRVVRVPDAGHWLMRQQPDLVNREIGAFAGPGGG